MIIVKSLEEANYTKIVCFSFEITNTANTCVEIIKQSPDHCVLGDSVLFKVFLEIAFVSLAWRCVP